MDEFLAGGRSGVSWERIMHFVYWANDPNSLPAWLRGDEADKFAGGWKLVKNGERFMWLVQQNRRGRKNLFEHKVEWTRENREQDSEESVGIIDPFLSDDDSDHIRDEPDSDSGDWSEPPSQEVQDRMVDDLLDNISDDEFPGNTSEDGSEVISECISYAESEREESEEEPPGKGAGSGNNFVASLRRGDRIGVWERVMVSVLTSYPLLSYIFHLGWFQTEHGRIGTSRCVLLNFLIYSCLLH
jgi:hypothetical protein